MENRKKQYSRMVIEEALLKLLHQKPLEKISVVEICKLANINRSTFYSNYMNVFDLMDQVADNFFETLCHQFIAELGEPELGSVDTSKEMIRTALYASLEQRELCQLLMGSSRKADFTKKLLDALLEWSLKRYLALSGREPDNFYLENTMVLGGALVLWQRWIENGFQESPEYLAHVINTYLEVNSKRIWIHHQQ